MPSPAQPRRIPRPVWTVAQVVGVGLTVALLYGLLRYPEGTLHLLWDMVIPLLPAVFLINPMLWRNACPLATLNQWTGRRQAPPLDRDLLRGAWAVGIVLLAVLVPARRFLFNTDGTALAATIAAVGGLAMVTGLRFPRRAGFCNSLCPVLPVEKLYGQAPLVAMGGPRCVACDLCTPAGCIDLAGAKSARQSVTGTRGLGWLVSPFGIFAAAFPGFIVGYFTTENTGFGAAAGVYLHILAWAAGSYLVAAGLALVLRPAVPTALLLLGAASVSLYYWLVAPGLAAAYGAPDTGPAVVRVAALALVMTWLWRAVRPPRRSPGGAAHG